MLCAGRISLAAAFSQVKLSALARAMIEFAAVINYEPTGIAENIGIGEARRFLSRESR
jgi:hypothetical protein